jgi:thioredoxin 1
VKVIRVFLLIIGLTAAAASGYSAVRDIYPDPSLAKPQIAAALKTAAREHKRVLLDFGGNWCGDCHVLDMYFHNAENLPILEKNFVLVHVNVGELDTNLDIAEQYGAPVTHGVPELAVLSETGKLLYCSKDKALELAVQHGDTAAVTGFLVRWKPGSKGCSVVAVNC